MNLHLACSAILLVLATQLAFSSAAVQLYSLRAVDLTGDALGNKPDPYLKVWCEHSFGGMTESVKDTSNPRWNAEFSFPKCKTSHMLKLEVWDKDLHFDDYLGTCIRTVIPGRHSIMCRLKDGFLYYKYSA